MCVNDFKLVQDLQSSAEKIDGKEDVTKAKTETSGDGVKKQISVEPDDVLKIDCTDEVDEFTNFLNEFEDELKSPTTDGPKKSVVAEANKGPKPKKTKIILVKKKVKKVKNQTSRAPVSRPRLEYTHGFRVSIPLQNNVFSQMCTLRDLIPKKGLNSSY